MPAVPCPSCGEPLPARSAACPSCQLPLTGPHAVRLWEIDQSLAALNAERPHVLAALRAQGRSVTAPPAAELPAAPPAGVATAPPMPLAQTPTPMRRWTAQQTLLAVGVLLVLVASVVFLAVAWSLIGVTGQVLAMGTLTAVAAYGALRLSRHHLSSSAEAMAVLSAGMMLVDLAAARALGLAGLEGVDPRTYGAFSGTAAAVVLGLLHRRDQRIAAFGLLSLAAATGAWASVVAWGDDSAPLASALALVGALLFAGLHARLPRWTGLVRRLASGPAAGWFSVGAATAAVGALDEARSTGMSVEGLTCVALLAAIAAGGSAVVGRVVHSRAARSDGVDAVATDWWARPLSGSWRSLGAVAVVATGAAPTAVGALALRSGVIGTVVLASVCGVATLALLAMHPFGAGRAQRWAQAQAAAVLAALVGTSLLLGSTPALVVALAVASVVSAAAVVLVTGYRVPAVAISVATGAWAVAEAAGLVSRPAQALTLAAVGLVVTAAALIRRGQPEEPVLGGLAAAIGGLALAESLSLALHDGVVTAALAAVTLEAVAVAVLRPRLRLAAAGLAAATGSWAVALAGGLVSTGAQVAGLALVGLVLAGAAAWRRTEPEEAVLAAAHVVVAGIVVSMCLAQDWSGRVALLAAVFGLVCAGYAALPGRRPAVILAVVWLTGCAWTVLDEVGVETLEAYTLSCAALALAAGLWSRPQGGGSSWLGVGPAASIALLPSALASFDDDPLARVLLAVVASAGVLVLGARLRWQALVVVGSVAAGLVAISQLGPYAVGLPRWLTLGVTGAVLLLLGARYERSMTEARRAADWLSGLR